MSETMAFTGGENTALRVVKKECGSCGAPGKDACCMDPSVRCHFMAALYDRFDDACGRSEDVFRRQSLIGLILI